MNKQRTEKGGRRKAEDGRSVAKHSLSAGTISPGFRFLFVVLIAVALSWWFWAPLWNGGSLIGGDLFPYFFPQKVFLATQLQNGVIPAWNPLTGHGYPTIAESQTGVCYPPDLAAYRWLSVTTAYNTLQIVHYILAFVGTWLLAKKLGCSFCGALLAALSFVYGWFPPRICLEWAIVTGAYLPWVMWCAESFLQEHRHRYLFGLCLLLALQLLAGHFHLAFLTQLTLAVYVLLRSRILVQSTTTSSEESPDPAPQPGTSKLQPSVPAFQNTLLIGAAILMAFLLAAVQLAPTWELKQLSQRSEVSGEHQPNYGHMPPEYWSQVVVPWLWYGPGLDERILKLNNFAGGALTNKVEAHLYFGLIPLFLALGGLLANWRDRSASARTLRLWLLIGLAFLLYTPGWFHPLTQYLPGFNFFRGPGRYGFITSLAVALAAGQALSQLLSRQQGMRRWLFAGSVLLLTTIDLGWVASQPWYSVMLPGRVVEQRVYSPLRELLARESQPVRLFSPMPNFANLLDVSATPVYLGIGPQEYFDPQFTLPIHSGEGLDPKGDPAQIRWLQNAGVTHIFSLDPLPVANWPVKLVWTGPDPLVNMAFGRNNTPTFLYELQNSRGRIAWETSDDPAAIAEITAYSAHRIEATCNSTTGGTLVLTDLIYPGWTVSIDQRPATIEASGMFRAVKVGPGPHEIVWVYRPASVYWGSIISVATLICFLVGTFVVCFRSRWTSLKT